MSSTTAAFTNKAVPYAAFNLRDPYYREMATFVANAAKTRLGGMPVLKAVDLAAGIGISTMVVRDILKPAERLTAVEPEVDMRHMCSLHLMGDPRAYAVPGTAEDFAGVLGAQCDTDVVCCCQAFHLFNSPNNKGALLKALQNVSDVLRPGGVFAFDLGPSNYKFAIPLADHRTGDILEHNIVTELAHPLYQRVHAIALGIVRKQFPDFDRETLWPAAAARSSFKQLKMACDEAGLMDLRVNEDLLPMDGKRVLEFIRNGWSVFMRWPPLSDLSTGQKLGIMEKAIARLYEQENFAEMLQVTAYHPTAVFTAVRAT